MVVAIGRGSSVLGNDDRFLLGFAQSTFLLLFFFDLFVHHLDQRTPCVWLFQLLVWFLKFGWTFQVVQSLGGVQKGTVSEFRAELHVLGLYFLLLYLEENILRLGVLSLYRFVFLYFRQSTWVRGQWLSSSWRTGSTAFAASQQCRASSTLLALALFVRAHEIREIAWDVHPNLHGRRRRQRVLSTSIGIATTTVLGKWRGYLFLSFRYHQ